MNKVTKVAFLGAGALGASFASKFHDTPECSTVLIARGDRYDRLRRDGLVVNGNPYAFPVVRPDEADSPADLIMVAVKHHHLTLAVDDLRKFVGTDTTILSVMNGLDSEEIIGSVYGAEKVLYSISVGIDAVRRGNRITYSKPGKIYFGQADNTLISQRVRRVQKLFDRAGIVHETPADMIRTLWWKFMINVGMNQASAVTRAPYGVFQSSPHARALMEALMLEVVVLAKKAGVSLEEKDLADWYAFLDTLSPQGKTSMLQDVEARRKTEVDIFAGKVVDLGKNHNIPTPVNGTLLQIIRVLEQALD